jgi:hypothetical protein
MTDSTPIQSPETVLTRSKLPDCSVDLPTVIRQIRVCRSTLGAILDELECGDIGAEAAVGIAECAISVTAEIESLWKAAGKSK